MWRERNATVFLMLIFFPNIVRSFSGSGIMLYPTVSSVGEFLFPEVELLSGDFVHSFKLSLFKHIQMLIH